MAVVVGVSGRGHHGHQGVQVRGPADPGDLASAGEVGGDGDGVGRLAAAVQIQDRSVEDLVGRAVEVGFAHDLDHVGDGVLAQEHRPEDGLLSRNVVGRGAIGPEVLVGDAELCNAHEGPPTRCPRTTT
jgi:hypothetical protein